MGNEVKGQQNPAPVNQSKLQADRAKFMAQHKASGNGSFSAGFKFGGVHRREAGNSWARLQLAKERRDDQKLTGAQGESARLEGEAWGKAGDRPT